MATRSLVIRLADIRDEIVGIRDTTKNIDAETFAASWLLRRAVERALLIIAEAAKHVSIEWKQAHPVA